MRFEADTKLDFKDVLIRPKRSTLKSRAEVNLKREYTFHNSKNKWQGVPIVAANMDHTGTFEVAKALVKHDLMTAMHKFYTVENWVDFANKNKNILKHCFVSAGIRDDDLKKLKSIMKKINAQNICVDVANGYTQIFVDTVRKIRQEFPQKTIMAGNVVTGEMVEELIISGADIVKVGIGPGSVCTTRKKTGDGLQGHVCADGGCTVPGDVAKAFAAGADFVMLGGMFSGFDECQGKLMKKNGKQFKRFYGMSSAEAMEKYRGKVAKYRASEGKSIDVPYRGTIENAVLDILGGIRSTCTYVGAAQLKSLSKKTTFIRVTQQLNEVYKPFEVSE